MDPFALLRRLNARIGTTAEIENATIVVCGSVSNFPDDVRALCAGCGRVVFHRPYIPPRPVRVCMACAPSLAKRLGTH